MSVGQLHARLEPVQRAAVRTSGLALVGHVQIDARMLAPQCHLGIGAEDRQVGGVQLDGRVLGGRLAHGGTETEGGFDEGNEREGVAGLATPKRAPPACGMPARRGAGMSGGEEADGAVGHALHGRAQRLPHATPSGNGGRGFLRRLAQAFTGCSQ